MRSRCAAWRGAPGVTATGGVSPLRRQGRAVRRDRGGVLGPDRARRWTRRSQAAPDDALERFRATGIAYVTFAVEHPEHFRALSVPGLFARMPGDRMARANAWATEERAALQRAQDAGEIAAIPLDDLMLAATSLTHGVAMQIVEGKFGKVDVARARELAIAATAVLGAGLVPRSEPWHDPRTGREVAGRRRR